MNMEREKRGTNRAIAVSEEDDSGVLNPEPVDGEAGKPGAFQAFRTLLEKAGRTQKPTSNRHELSRDKSKSVFLLVGGSIALLLIFLGVFSSPKRRTPLPGENARGAPSLGRETTPGQEENDPAKTVTPMLSADVRQGENVSGSQVTPQEVGSTSPSYHELPGASSVVQEKPAPGRERGHEEYALKNVDFSDPAVAQAASVSNSPRVASGELDSDLKKPSMVFVRATQSPNPALQRAPQDDTTLEEILPAGTRLVARLEAPVSSAVPAPIIAVVEYNYERNGEIVLPAGAKVIGKLSHVSPSGYVGFQFDRVETPDGSVEKIDATAMDLKFGPLKGAVSGRNRGKNFFVRSVTGIGTVAAYAVGGQGTTGFNGPISENSLLRERLADNVGMAGQDEINTLAANQTIVVTVPGNTRFYIVVEKGGSDEQIGRPAVRPADNNTGSFSQGKVPTLEELRELMQLRSELNEMYVQASAQPNSGQQ
jgi:type IV secretory pathway VirB10-like protein